MTADINGELGIPVHPLPVGTDVAVVAGQGLADAGLVALIESFRLRCAIVDLDDPGIAPAAPTVKAVIVRSPAATERARKWAPSALLVGIGVTGAPDMVVLPDTADSAPRLRALLDTGLAARVRHNPNRVHLTPREREVLGTYVLGSTVYETAKHHFISESTVRSHFRRVVSRYTNEGRPVNNKSQLLMELIADGWLDDERIAR
ncbi:DNA-binding response regulator [Gordonia amarae]|uniref:DNA-binding response regulator n=2 Tax=Gordonia amarae TaxID=36821 RepID=A0A857M6B1_9ACTN|nr:helix-turn-helix transcriptional regulator [Gordonia amarae]MCS3876821.1 DNA-binding CsgD family transcriptional regulator [Gordonia amarae]QHN15663.1 DNA-binding response regulator [Gordonia amarae]QHN20232.1 DNA-binding response regulator [Gordonia amarae]QHN29083.1 DNA-binding response regulator [Gordonia amarae]QHN37863.1 DNA-binding response regulator [Gordonia amarae]